MIENQRDISDRHKLLYFHFNITLQLDHVIQSGEKIKYYFKQKFQQLQISMDTTLKGSDM